MRWSLFALRWGAGVILFILPTLAHGAIIGSHWVVRKLDALIARRGRPAMIVSET
jgi:hypothetical protein